jgi:regulator of protease activity HflC (stomatin/prohibitin superfamily)
MEGDMLRVGLLLRVVVQDGERALLLRNGRYDRVLEPGLHRLFDPLGALKVETFNVVRAEFPAERYAVLKAERPDLAAALFEAVETKADEVAIVSLDGRPAHLLAPWQVRVYWKVATAVTVARIDVTSDPKVSANHLGLIERARNPHVLEAVVENHEAGLLYVEGRLVARLAPGRHAYWTVGRKIEVKKLDLRPQAVEITAQEMLTKDRIALRVTAWCSSRSARRWPPARWMRCCRRSRCSTRSCAPSCVSASARPGSR